MTSSARGIRYGRRAAVGCPGPPRVDGLCATCETFSARWEARKPGTDERWPVCNRCRTEGERLRARATYGPLPAEERS